MSRPDRRRQFQAGIARVCFQQDSFALSVGDLSVILDRRGAQDVVAVLTGALLSTLPVDPPGLRPPRKRRRTRPHAS
jgi:hypothetical protein